MKGKKPISDKEKKRKGYFRPSRARGEVAVTLLGGVPEPPEWFDMTAKLIYQDTANELQAAGLLQKIGLPLIIMYSKYLAIAYNAERNIAKRGRFYKSTKKDGEIIWKANPYHRVSIEAFNTAHKVALEFGITLASQARVASLVRNKKKENNDDDFT